MTVLGLDHVNLRTADPARTLGFFRDALAMKVAAPPGMAADGRGGWVYDSHERPVVHVGALETRYPTDESLPFSASKGGGVVHHVALSCTDYQGVRARLQALDLAFVESDYPQIGLRQIFVSEPDGVLFELNFRDAEG
jgi:catechol 2,3-dioxygenase-like lactoylglutathione lyase family enzyme